MKKIILALILLLSIFNGYSQRGEKIEALKVAFISERLGLDAKTAEKFWPVYHQYEGEMKAFFIQKKANKDDLTAEDLLEQEQKALDIKKKYAPQFLKVISNDQLTNLYKAEKDFRQMVMRRAKRNN